MINNEVKYQTILANLQNIETNDSSLFSSVDNEKFFDVFNAFGKDTFHNFYENFHLDFILKENGNRVIADKVRESNSKQEIIAIFRDFNRRMDSDAFKLLNTNIEKAKTILINKLETEFQKSIVKWKKILNTANNINIETNIWPLHLGFLFVSIKTEKKTIFAPLFFKEVTFKIQNSLVHLQSNSAIRVNSKLITFLGQEGFMIDANKFDFENASIKEVYEKVKSSWNSIYDIPESISTSIPNIGQDMIVNTSIEFHPGMVLGFYNVSSGYLWNQMKKIIENNEFDNILNPDINKTKYVEIVKKSIFDKHFKLFKIQKTNFSQDCATISSLYQDTIIWGPPGTGKSQTITNLIVNIIAHGYSGLVVSQKKAALEVLQSRLKSLSKFCLFTIHDKNYPLEDFYEPLKEYIYELEHCSNVSTESGISIFSNSDKDFVDTISKFDANKNIDNILNFYSAIINIAPNFTISIFNTLLAMNPNIKYNLNRSFADKKSILKHLYEVNNNRMANMFTIYPKAYKEAAEIIFNEPSLSFIDVDKALQYVHLVTFKEVKSTIEDYAKILQEKTIDINDQRILSQMILDKKFKALSEFNDEQKTKYNNFAFSVRTAQLPPHKFFHEHRDIIKFLFPIIITTPDIDLSLWEKEEFDYAILDESSQMFLEKGIPILYLAKRKILAGDGQQMQPTRWFSVTYNFDEYDELGHIESLLTYAKNRGVFSMLLDKNYRSKLAALMTFSSKHFYNSRLDVIDDYERSLSKDKAIDVIQVDGSWNNSMNIEEGAKVIEIIKDNLNKYKQIIVLVFNIKQQDYLTNLIFATEPEIEEAMNSGAIKLKNIENIQGDEADLVIMSVVYDKNTALYGTYVARKGGKNALNVAVSRAREKIIVVKSIYADDVEITENSTSDVRIFKEWLKFLDLSLEEQKNYLFNDEYANEKIANTRSISLSLNIDFKVKLLNELQKLTEKYENLHFIGDYSIGTKALDIVLTNKLTNKLVHGFIVDSFDYVNNYEQYLKFKDGIRFLKSKAYPITIINKYEWIVKHNEFIRFITEKLNEENNYNLNHMQSYKVAQNNLSVEIENNMQTINNQNSQDNILPFNLDSKKNNFDIESNEIADEVDLARIENAKFSENDTISSLDKIDIKELASETTKISGLENQIDDEPFESEIENITINEKTIDNSAFIDSEKLLQEFELIDENDKTTDFNIDANDEE
ncbi:AAA domain-containing protein [Metamycoplasma equirhinis]|uniref:AAA domain-containing protein n=3 Tax=Metamycoplasma equirhinis TaxID=92402 RepID=UPI003593F402